MRRKKLIRQRAKESIPVRESSKAKTNHLVRIAVLIVSR
jgi:hypothetical protein